MVLSLLRSLRGLSLGIWLGSGVMTFLVASYVFFGGFIDKNTAGDIMAPILHAGGIMKIGLAVVALGSHFGLGAQAASGPKAKKIGSAMLVLATLCVFVVVLYLEPMMLQLRPQFRNDSDLNNPAHRAFAKLHGASMGTSTLEILFIAVALICAVI